MTILNKSMETKVNINYISMDDSIADKNIANICDTLSTIFYPFLFCLGIIKIVYVLIYYNENYCSFSHTHISLQFWMLIEAIIVIVSILYNYMMIYLHKRKININKCFQIVIYYFVLILKSIILAWLIIGEYEFISSCNLKKTSTFNLLAWLSMIDCLTVLHIDRIQSFEYH